MGLFSNLRKNKQEPASGDSEFYSRAEEESAAIRGNGKRQKRKQSDQSADQVLPEKKRARRRLVGAAALVLAAVIGLPMILDSQPKPLADDITIQIPSKDEAQASGMPPLAAKPPRIAAADALDQKEEVVNAPTAPATPAHTAPARQEIDTAKATPADKPAAVTAAPARGDAKPSLKAETPRKPEQKTAVPADKGDKAEDAARAAAILEGKPVAKPATDGKSDRIVLQVAALASKEKIDELQGKLKKAGIASHTQKVATESGDRTRIRVGPFASKEEADKMRARLARLGLNGTAVSAGQ